jgi:glycosyltransferase involved in cell wall biosynthesis
MRAPSISTVIATRGRGELLRRAIRSIAAQDYAGALEIVVVYDQSEVDELDDLRGSLGTVTLVTCSNDRSPGLAGGRNCGIARATGDLVAFCDDDDEWFADKLSAQVALWDERPDAVIVSSGITIVTQEGTVDRTPPVEVTRDDLLRSRIGELHPSSFLFRRADLLAVPGGVDEAIPFSYGEDYDLLLQATERGGIVSVDRPLVIVHWDRASYFAGRWEAMAKGLSYLLTKHTELAHDDVNAARMFGQVAFASAAAGARNEGWSWARRAIGRRFAEPRGWLALIVLARLTSPQRVVEALNSRGRGI